jgi:hypothetical protein
LDRDCCAESYLDTFAGMTRETIPLLLEAAHIGITIPPHLLVLADEVLQ